MTTVDKHPVLLVDDEPEILFSLRSLLRREFELYTAESGAQALELLKSHPIHVIMTDQRMPGMTGAELLRQVQSHYPAAVRIMFTGYADIRAVIDAINEGHVFHYLTKPWDPDDLLGLLHRACNQYYWSAERTRLLADLRTHVAGCQSLLEECLDGKAEGATQAATALLGRLDQALSPGARPEQ